MRIAYNPKTSGPLPQAPGNNDITFDLAAKVIYARGTAFDGKAYKTFKKHDYDDDSGGWDGLVPAPSYSTANVRLLREDGQWVHIAGISSPDQELDEESINSVENKVITKKINELIALIGTKAVDVYKNIKVGSTTIVAKGVNDTLEFKLGNGIIITPNATNKSLEFSINATGNLGIDTSYDSNQLIVKILDEYYNKWNSVYGWYTSVTEEDTDKYVNKWQEILDFLNKVDNTEGADITDEFVTRKTNLIITGLKTFSTNGINTTIENGTVRHYISTDGGWARGFSVSNTSGNTTVIGSFGVYGEGIGTGDNKIGYLYASHQDLNYDTAVLKIYKDAITVAEHEVYHKGNLKNLSDLTDDIVSGKYLPLNGGVLSGDISFGADGITQNNTGTNTRLPSHIYRNVYDTSGNVYDHYFNPRYTASTNTFANLRVATSGGMKVLRFGGDGTFTWDGNTVIHSGNIGDQSVGTADKLKNKVKIWGQDFDGSSDVSGVIYGCTTIRDANNNWIVGKADDDNGEVSLGSTAKAQPVVMRNSKGEIFLNTSGNVGIGTTDPKYRLHVNGNISALRGIFGKVLVNKGYGNNVGDQTIETSDEGMMLYLQYYHNGGINLCQGGGNVGIGTTNPKHKLDVNGNINTSGIVTAVNFTGNLNHTLTFSVGAFSAKTYNNSAAVTVNVPTHTSHLTNDSGFLTSHQSLANYVTLNTNLTISGVKTFSTLLKFTVAEGTAPFSVTSTKVVTKLNADLLDGYNADGLFTNLSNDTNLLSVTIGGTNKKLTIDYAKAARVLTSSAGTATNPVYFSDGKPVACTYSLNKTVPANAKFTDTWRGITDSYTGTETAVSLSQKGANNLYKALLNGYASSAGDSTKWGGYNIVVGSAGTDANTIYFVL